MRQIPNAITLLNLICGCAAILMVLQGQWYAAAAWLAGAALADFADGLVARALGVSSPEGKELDSLADVVSFGVAPGMVLYSMLVVGSGTVNSMPLENGIYWAGLPVFVLSAFSALRLARFNLDERQTEDFIGLATPACTLLVVGLMLLYAGGYWGAQSWLPRPMVIYPLVAVLSYLLVAEVPMFSFKFKHGGWQGNALRYIFAGAAVLLLLIWREAALAPIVLLYLALNMGRHLARKRKKA